MLQRSSATALAMSSLMPLTGKSFLPRIWSLHCSNLNWHLTCFDAQREQCSAVP